jgi:hypothetical protein
MKSLRLTIQFILRIKGRNMEGEKNSKIRDIYIYIRLLYRLINEEYELI